MFSNKLWLDITYAKLVSGSLDQFKIQKPNPFVANFRCVYCHDSQKNKFKARGYLFEGTGSLVYSCRNCGKSTSFSSFLFDQNQILYSQYRMELLKNEAKPPILEATKPTPAVECANPLAGLKRVTELRQDHAALRYLQGRKIPEQYHSLFYYAPLFYEWVNGILPDKIASTREEQRLIIPFIDKGGHVFGCQGRALDKSELRYLTVLFDPNKHKIFGLDRVDFSRRFYIFEGAFDSLFIDNSLAVAGADIDITKYTLGNNFVDVLDNEPRNREIVRRMEVLINQGHRVCIWPDWIAQKDVNDMVVKAGMPPEHIKNTIDSNSCQGLEAKLRLSSWRRD
jgi:hypothetical protein